LIAHLHDEGYKLILWHTSWINNKTMRPGEQGFAGKIPTDIPATNYAEAERNGYFLHRPDGSTYVNDWWKGSGSLIDFTNPAAKKWWQGQVGKAIAMGADGFKDDDAEGNFLVDVKFASGEDQRLVRNRYAVDLQSRGGRGPSPSARARIGCCSSAVARRARTGCRFSGAAITTPTSPPRTAFRPWLPPA